MNRIPSAAVPQNLAAFFQAYESGVWFALRPRTMVQPVAQGALLANEKRGRVRPPYLRLVHG